MTNVTLEGVETASDAAGERAGESGVARLREENKRLSALNKALTDSHNFYLVESSRWEDRAKEAERKRVEDGLTPSSLVCCKCGRSWNWIKRDGQCGRTDYDNPCPTLPLRTASTTPSPSTRAVPTPSQTEMRNEEG